MKSKLTIFPWWLIPILLIVIFIEMFFLPQLKNNSSTQIRTTNEPCDEDYSDDLDVFFMDEESLPNNWVLDYSRDEKSYEHVSYLENGFSVWKKFYNVYFGLYKNNEGSLDDTPKMIGQRIFYLDSYEMAEHFYDDENRDFIEVPFNYRSGIADEYGYFCSKNDKERCHWIAQYGCLVTIIATSVSDEYIRLETFQNFILFSDKRFDEVLLRDK